MCLRRYKKAEERSSLNDAMVLLLPLIHQMCSQLLTDQSELSVTIQKHILKTFFALIQVSGRLYRSGQSVYIGQISLYIGQVIFRQVPAQLNAPQQSGCKE